MSGLLVAPGNADDLAPALERLASSPQDRERMGVAGRRKVVEDFDAERCAAQLAKCSTKCRRREARRDPPVCLQGGDGAAEPRLGAKDRSFGPTQAKTGPRAENDEIRGAFFCRFAMMLA